MKCILCSMCMRRGGLLGNWSTRLWLIGIELDDKHECNAFSYLEDIGEDSNMGDC